MSDSLTPDEYRALVRSRWTEAEFTRATIRLAQSFGWKAAHFRTSQTQKGHWITAVQGDGKGFPDLLLLHPRRGLLAAELKVKTKTTPEQEAWLLAFRAAGVPAFVWYPKDWPEIKRLLTDP